MREDILLHQNTPCYIIIRSNLNRISSYSRSVGEKMSHPAATQFASHITTIDFETQSGCNKIQHQDVLYQHMKICVW